MMAITAATRRLFPTAAVRLLPLLGCVAACLSITAGDLRAGQLLERIPVRGVVRAVEQATIATEIALRATEIPRREGERFRRGDTLAVFDCARQIAERDGALAGFREATLNLESNEFLDRHQAVGKNEVEITRARADKARADLAALEARLVDCRLVAPFDGRIAELSLRVHERSVPQKPFISILDDSRLEIELIAPSTMLAQVQPGARFDFVIDELGGRIVHAEVGNLGASVDPVSKTVKLIGIISPPVTGILAGMSGTASFELDAQQ